MATNYIQPGSVVTVTAPADVASGAGVLIGTLFGVATQAAKSGEPLELKTDGVWELAKTSAQAWATVGLAIYATSAGLLTTTATDNVLVGKNIATAANPSPTGTVRLNG